MCDICKTFCKCTYQDQKTLEQVDSMDSQRTGTRVVKPFGGLAEANLKLIAGSAQAKQKDW